MGVGGGVCQASTTVYLAAIQSGMTITSRDAHSNPVNYTSLGMDATVSDTRGREVDFAFKNESGGRIFIAAHVVESGSNRRSLLCEVRIYGPSLENVYYRLESETVEVIPKPEEPKLKEDKTGEKAYYVDEMKLASKGREGYVVDTYLCIYQDDVLISRDKVSTDTYPARQDVMWVGVNLR
jgi:vancomycin resistance protein YoaR